MRKKVNGHVIDIATIYPFNFVADAGLDPKDCSVSSIECVLNSDLLTDREREMVEDRYSCGMTYENLAKKYNVSHSRAAAIIQKVRQKIRYSARTGDPYVAPISTVAELKAKNNELQWIVDNYKDRSIVNELTSEAKKTRGIETLDLDTRTLHALVRWRNCRTIEDILKLSDYDLYRTRNYGRKCHSNLINSLNEIGIEHHFTMDIFNKNKKHKI